MLARADSLLELLYKGILHSLREGRSDPFVNALQLRHLCRAVGDGLDADAQFRRDRKTNDTPGSSTTMTRGVGLFGDDNEDAVLKFFVGDRLIVK